MKTKALRRCCLILIGCALLLSSCIMDDLEHCMTQVTIRFNYAYQVADAGEEFPAAVKEVRLYIFNDADLFLGETIQGVPDGSTQNSFLVDFDFAPGTYTIVTWAGEWHDRLSTALTDEGTMTPGTLVPGVTTLSQALLLLTGTVPEARGSSTAMVAGMDTPVNLFHGLNRDVEVISGRSTQINANLAHSSYHVEVCITDLRTVRPDVTACDVSARLGNAALTFDHDVYAMAPAVGYLPYLIKDENSHIRTSTLSVMRMRPDTKGDLVVTDSRDGRELFRRSLVEDILLHHPLVKPDPAAGLDKYSRFRIDLEITDSRPGIGITIADWTVRLVDTDM
ncbi:FimB/Mfa2 family fimbrial subunit [Bacteroides fragilis]|uniref:FimB/Mfa2 family fimbrial subunit n=1 Tax=Bacteroides fragilis TaxID=817 RepID=UPI0020300EE8|nr:FimB/Mfa2 family fimbrial subunit [Bacteroides fragilis]MCM0322783.1 FimB/Mfa2 family fimbrial subunit [Bacteroides fragilis]